MSVPSKLIQAVPKNKLPFRNNSSDVEGFLLFEEKLLTEGEGGEHWFRLRIHWKGSWRIKKIGHRN